MRKYEIYYLKDGAKTPRRAMLTASGYDDALKKFEQRYSPEYVVVKVVDVYEE